MSWVGPSPKDSDVLMTNDTLSNRQVSSVGVTSWKEVKDAAADLLNKCMIASKKGGFVVVYSSKGVLDR